MPPTLRATISSLKATHTAHRLAVDIANPLIPQPSPKQTDPQNLPKPPPDWMLEDKVVNQIKTRWSVKERLLLVLRL